MCRKFVSQITVSNGAMNKEDPRKLRDEIQLFQTLVPQCSSVLKLIPFCLTSQLWKIAERRQEKCNMLLQQTSYIT